jgi:diguanylate cyclase (GGDEF)-like protein
VFAAIGIQQARQSMPLSIKYKASLPVILLALTLVTFTGLSIYLMGDVEQITESLAMRHHELEQVQYIEITTSELVFPHLDYLTTRNPDTKHTTAALFDRLTRQLQYLRKMKVVHEEERELLDFTAKNLRTAKQISQQIFTYHGTDHHHYMQLLHDLSESHLVPIRNKLVEWHIEEARDVNELNEKAETLLHDYLLGAATVLLLVIVLVTFTLWFNKRILIRPLLAISRTANLIATGNFKEKSSVHSQDELGELALNINDMALSLEQMYSELNSQARTDQLTGVLNRLAMEEILQHELAAACRNSRAFSIAVFDLDNFKTVNDGYGHPVGDKVLRAVIEIVLTTIRRCDYCFRYGGEEFLLLLPNTDATTTVQVLERCRQAIKKNPLHVDGNNIPITASFGLAGYPHDGCDIATLITNADEALYTAKNSGKNKIIDYASVVHDQLTHQAS